MVVNASRLFPNYRDNDLMLPRSGAPPVRLLHARAGACNVPLHLRIGTVGLLCVFAALFLISIPVAVSAKEAHVHAKLIADVIAIRPGQPFRLGVELTMEPGWHSYYKDPGDAGMATKIDWLLPPGFIAGSLKWEKPSRFNEAGIITFGYTKTTLIAALITTPKKPGSRVTLKAKVKWLSCKDICIPGGQEVSLTLPVSSLPSDSVDRLNVKKFADANFDGPVSAAGSTTINSNNFLPRLSIIDQKWTIADRSSKSLDLLTCIGLAIVGGIILNFMPCVLPVVAIKLISLLEEANGQKARIRLLGFVFSLGIVSSFLALACVVIAMQGAGQHIGWGFQFQYPPFVIAMATIILVFALSLFGQLNIGINIGQKEAGRLANNTGLVGTFVKGVLATILATPCTAPFLGTALGFAFVQPWWVILSIFCAIGLGMALPYLLLTIEPGWMRFLPKPGAWMEKLKEAFGFVLLATVIWLISILGNQVGMAGMMRTTYFLLSVAAAVWIMNRFSDLASSSKRILCVRAIAFTIVSVAFYGCIFSAPFLLYPSSNLTDRSHDDDLEAFSLTKLESALKSGKTVFVDFTAKWCLTCQVNEVAVLHTPAIVEKFKALNVVTMKADWTNQDPSITELLQKFGRSGVPLYVIFPAKAPNQPIVLPEILTTQLLLQKLDEAGPSLSSTQ